VHGIDASTDMVDRLRRKADGDRVTVRIGDFAVADELVDGPYAMAYLVFNSLFELESQERQVRCFEGVAAVLAPGGVFVVEAFAPDLSRLDAALTVVGIDDATTRVQATRHDPVTQVVNGQTITITTDGIELWPFDIRYATAPEIDLMARVAGLRRRERWGGWAGEPFTEASSRHVSVYELSGSPTTPR
jgi:hypothetical protein